MQHVTNQSIRIQNRRNILKYIFQARQTSRQNIARDLQMSMPTVLQNLSELYELGIIKDAGQYESTGGRKATVIMPVTDYRLSLGVSITANHLELVIVGLDNEVLRGTRLWKPYANTQDYYTWMKDTVTRFVDAQPEDREKIIGVGISIPGFVDNEHHLIADSHSLGLVNMPYRILSGLFPWPCYFSNDANASGLAEVSSGEYDGNIVYLSLSTSVGGAIFINGHLYTGQLGHSGEFGHMCIEPDGLPCYCGKRGCLDAYCSTKRLADATSEGKLGPFFEQLKAGDPKAVELWNDYITHLARAVVSIHMIFDCNIVLGGFMCRWLEPYIGDICAEIAKLDPFYDQHPYVCAGIVGRWVSAIGAGLIPVRQFLNTI